MDLKEQLHQLELDLRKQAELELEKLINEKGDEAAQKVIDLLKEQLPTMGDIAVDFLAPRLVAILKQLLLSQVEKISDEV